MFFYHSHGDCGFSEVEGLSQRQIATKLGISRNTVSKYLKMPYRLIIFQRTLKRPRVIGY
ncbi:sigma factor-like helix-turn-helix DNA-binding protein [Cytobacillus purgationiresistens]|uniref:sigma factor-like helix-turn-helix DNA-binding protein n=1 Tax=Cytobacillus purgationiresistens TaxID=863449 RepID=UPI0027D8F403|nr:sigma factor-like helix-turn-helix DNA-binding protein [Cytobacillus purgationiresistens]